MSSLLATKADIAELKADLARLEVKLTIRMGQMQSATIGILLAGIKLML